MYGVRKICWLWRPALNDEKLSWPRRNIRLPLLCLLVKYGRSRLNIRGIITDIRPKTGPIILRSRKLSGPTRSRTEMGKKVFRNPDFCMCLFCANKWNKWKWFLCVSVCMFTQPDYSNSRGHEEQPLNPAVPRASTSAAADEVKPLYLLFSCITAWNINKFG